MACNLFKNVSLGKLEFKIRIIRIINKESILPWCLCLPGNLSSKCSDLNLKCVCVCVQFEQFVWTIWLYPFLFGCLFFTFFCLFAVTRTSNTMLNSSNESRIPCLFPDIIGKLSSISPFSLFNKQCWENWISTYKRVKFKPYFIPYA